MRRARLRDDEMEATPSRDNLTFGWVVGWLGGWVDCRAVSRKISLQCWEIGASSSKVVTAK